MKRILAITLSACLVLALTYCSKADDSSSSAPSSSSSQPSSGSQSTSQSQSHSGSSSSQASSSQSSSQSETPIDSSQWPMSFVNTTTSDGTAVLIEAAVPSEWKFDGYTTYSEGEKKVMEIMYAEKITDKDNPYSIPNSEQFTASEGDDGFGYIESQEVILPTTKAMLHLRKDYPHDSENPIYPHIYLVQKGDYIVVVSFTAYDESCQNLHQTFDTILDKIEVFI